MTRFVLLALLLALLLGCADRSVALRPAPTPPVISAVVLPSVPAAHAPVASVVRDYHRAERLEVPAITKPTVSADYVTRVREADTAARVALRVLEGRKGHPAPAALIDARAAVENLAGVLAEQP